MGCNCKAKKVIEQPKNNEKTPLNPTNFYNQE